MDKLSLGRMWLLAIAAGVVAGCGGGQAGVGGGSGGQVVAIGNASVSFSGNPKPQVMVSNGNVTVSSMAGASFTELRFNPTQNLDNTYLVYSRYINNGSQIYRWDYSNGVETELTSDPEGCVDPCVSKIGLVFYGENAFSTHIGSCVSDGSRVKILTVTTPGAYYHPTISPTSPTLAYDWGGGNLRTVSENGGTATTIQTSDLGLGNCWFPNGLDIAYAGNDGGDMDIYETPSSPGGTATDITPISLRGTGSFSNPSCSPDGLTIAATYTPTSATNSQIEVFPVSADTENTITPTGFSDSCPTYSPDGKWIAFYRTSAGGAEPGIYISSYSGSDQELVVPATSTNGTVESMQWSPFPISLELIGSSQFYANAASGFLLSQVGSSFGSLLAFTAAPASSATVTGASSSGNQPLVFTIGGTSITNIGYTNYYFNSGNFITPPASTTSALVTIDPATGLVDLVATASTSARPTPSARAASGNLTYTGHFTSIYDKTGKNLAPSGASQIVLDPKSGRMVSFK